MLYEKLERHVNGLLQRKVEICLNNKTLKTGKLILFSVKDFYICFTLLINNAKKVYEMPYPFRFDYLDHGITLHYQEKHITFKGKKPNFYSEIFNVKPNKFLNQQVHIKYVE
jgi:hypothetical protein